MTASKGPQSRTGPYTLAQVQDGRLETLIECLSEGMYMTEACAISGLTSSVVQAALKRGNIDIRNGNPDTFDADFTLKAQKAMGSAERDALRNIRAAGASANGAFWAANAWFLERRYPEKYGRKDRLAVEHSGDVGFRVQMKVSLDEVNTDLATLLLNHAANVEGGATGGPDDAGEGDESEYDDASAFDSPE